MNRRIALSTLTGLAAAVGTSRVLAQSGGYPSKPVRLIAPYAAGGGLDAVSRLLAQGLSELLGQNFIVENRAGAGGTIGAEAVARSAPDGYTLLMAGNPELVIAQAISPATVRYTTAKDFVPIVLVSESPNVLVAHPSIAASLADLLSGKVVPENGLAVGTPGQGSPQHISLAVLEAESRQTIVHLPYKGAGPVVADLLGGQIKLGLVGIPPVMPHIRAGKLRALAITQRKRSALAPEIPTIEEAAGIKGMDAFSTWYGMLAPTGTPAAVTESLQKAAMAVLAKPDVKARLASMGTELVALEGAAFGARIRDESKRYDDVVRKFNVKPG